MDLEVWMKNLGVDPVADSEKTEAVQVAYGAEKAAETAEDERLNVVFFLDRRALIDEEEFEEMKKVLTDTLKILLDNKITSENPDALLNINVPIVWTQSTSNAYTYYRITSSADIELISNVLQNSEEDILDITSALDHVIEEYSNKSTVFLVVTIPENIKAKYEKSSKVYQNLVASGKIHVAFVSKEMEPARYSYVEKIVEASGGDIIPDFNVAEITNEIYSFLDADEYMIITANNYERVRLDSILRKNSATDTDKDDCSDWNEVNTELIEDLKPGVTDKGYLLMDDMPTFGQCKKALGEELFYVREGLTRFREDQQVSGMPSSDLETKINETYITPIRSCPIDADSDNDGVIDFDDSKPLNETNRTPNPKNDESLEFGIAESYVIAKSFDIDLRKDSAKDFGNKIGLYVMPFYDAKQYTDIVFKHGDTVHATHLIISRGEKEKSKDESTEFRRIKYWIKTVVDGRFGYLPCDVLKYDIFSYILHKNSQTVNSLNADEKDANSNIFSGWYFPLPNSVGIISKIHMLSQRVQTCSSTCHAMGYNYFLSLGKIESSKGVISNSEDPDIWNEISGAKWATLGNLKLESIDFSKCTKEEYLNSIKLELKKGYPVILGASNTEFQYYENEAVYAGGLNHFVLIVGYTNDGDEVDDFIIIDPFSNLQTGNNRVLSYETTEAANYKMSFYCKVYSEYFVSYDGNSILVNGKKKYTGIRRNYYYCKKFIIEEKIDE